MPDKENMTLKTLDSGVEQETIEQHDIDSFSVKEQKKLPKISTDYLAYRRMGMAALFIVFVLFGGWSSVAPLQSSAVAVGEVVVTSNNKVVEHLEGGIVDEILVSEGQSVKQGDVLLKLSDTNSRAELRVAQARLNELLGTEARLIAERMFSDKIVFPGALLEQKKNNKQIQEVVDGQVDVFVARRDALQGELVIYGQRKEALSEQILGLKTVISNLEARIASFESEVKDWEALYKAQFADKSRLQEMKRSLARLRGEKGSYQSEIAQLKVQIAETQSQVILRKQQFGEKVVSELRNVQAEKVDVQTRLVALKDRLSRVDIIAPVAGRVNGLSVYTIGEVVAPGEQLMQIVPNSTNYAIKAKVMVTDIDKVNPGLIADVRFSAFNTQITHVIEGEVIHVSADKFTDQSSGFEYFEAKVQLTDAGYKQMKDDNIFLLPGMPAEVMIKTGERTLLGYFVKPFTNMFARSFNEE